MSVVPVLKDVNYVILVYARNATMDTTYQMEIQPVKNVNQIVWTVPQKAFVMNAFLDFMPIIYLPANPVHLIA